jgi:hypothetical protein
MSTLAGTSNPGDQPATGGSESPRPLWIAVFLIAATIVGVAAGWLKYQSGSAVSLALLTGGAGFAATVTLLVLVYRFATDKSA